MYDIKKVCIIGAGVMGCNIAIHFINCGFDVCLLDKPSENQTDRNSIARKSLNKYINNSPPLFFNSEDINLIKIGNIEDNSDFITQSDLIIEAVYEDVSVKKEIFELINKFRALNSIVATNTSGLSISELLKSDTLSQNLIENTVVLHFFNPVRYMKLVEIVKHKANNKLIDYLKTFVSEKLGKEIVFCKDTPNFIANRIGIFTFLTALKKAIKYNLSVEEVDFLLGIQTGYSKSAIFRTADIVGIDVLKYVALTNKYEIPKIINLLIKNKFVGEKTKKGFYEKKSDGLYSVDLTNESLVYNKLKQISIPQNDVVNFLAKGLKENNIYSLFFFDVLRETFDYTLSIQNEISENIYDIDKAMKYGYNYEIPIFEKADILSNITEAGFNPPLLSQNKFYKTIDNSKYYYDLNIKDYVKIEENKYFSINQLKNTNHEIEKTQSYSIYNIEDGVLLFKFNTKMNTIDENIFDGINKALDLVDYKKYKGLIISNEGEHFSFGANLQFILQNALEEKYNIIENAVKKFQQLNKRIKYSKFPVVITPFGMTFGGGCEMSMHSNVVVPFVETYMGLVEASVGLIPAGGGTKELLFKNLCKYNKKAIPEITKNYPTLWNGFEQMLGGDTQFVIKTMETILECKVSSSYKDAINLGYLCKNSTIPVINKNQLIEQSKEIILNTYNVFIPKEEVLIYLSGKEVVQTLIEMNFDSLLKKGVVTEYDKVIALELANVCSGGNTDITQHLTEDHILELECESFIRLLHNKQTQERIKHTLKTGKPLRN